MTNVTSAQQANQGGAGAPRISLPTQTLFVPSRDQTKVKHLHVSIKHVAKPSHSVAHLYVSCGNIGFPIAVHAPQIPDIFVGTDWVAEYPADGNPLDGNFTALYPANMKPEQPKVDSSLEVAEVGDGLSMTSLEIAALVEKRHDNVRRTIETLAQKGVIQLPQIEEVKNFQSLSPNSKAQAYRFTGEQGKRDSIIVVAQLSPEFTAKLVDRWQELEKQLAGERSEVLAIPQTLPEALRLAADLAEEKAKVESERDEAIRTKAMIGSKREASAMASAAKARREAARLRDELGRNSRHATIVAVEKALDMKFPRNAYVALRRWCKENGIPPAEVADDRYGLVKAWPAGAWLECHDIDLAELFGSDCLDLVIANQARQVERRGGGVMEILKLKITGTAPLMMHSDKLANPLDPATKAHKELTGKRKKTDDDHVAIAKSEFIAGAYWDKEVGFYVPGQNFDATFWAGAKLQKLGVHWKRGCLVVTDKAKLIFDGPRTPEKLWENLGFVDCRGVKVGQSKVMRYRLVFRDWETELEVAVNTDVIDLAEAKKAIEDAGALIGVCEYRPRFGRFGVNYE